MDWLDLIIAAIYIFRCRLHSMLDIALALCSALYFTLRAALLRSLTVAASLSTSFSSATTEMP